MEILDVQTFVAVVDRGSLKAAADALEVSAPTVSRRLARLEADLGVRLIERTTRALRPTELGHAFHERCTAGFETLASARDLVAARQRDVQGWVRLSTAPNLGSLLVGSIAALRLEHPGLRVQVIHTPRRLDLRNDDVDLLLRVGELADEGLVAREVGRYPHVLVAGRDYVEAQGAPASISALRTRPLVAFGSNKGSRGWELRSGERRVQIESEPVFLTNDYATLAAALEAGVGVGEMPAILLTEHPALVRVLPNWTLGHVPLALMYPADRLLATAVRVVVDALMKHLPDRIAARLTR